MVKFLKIVLFLVAFAFAFALGVRFSDSFKGKFGNREEAEIKVEEEMKKVFDGHEQKINEIEIEPQNNPPLIIEETETMSNDVVNSIDDTTNQNSDEIMESIPMDGIENAPIEINNNVIDNQVIDFDNNANVISAPEEIKVNGNAANPTKTQNAAPATNKTPTGTNTRKAQ